MTHDDLHDRLLGQLRHLVDGIRSEYRVAEKRSGLGTAAWRVLREVHRSKNPLPSEIAGTLQLHRSTVSNLLRELEVAGALRRERNGEDLREVRLAITPSGLRTLRQAGSHTTGPIERLIGKLTKSEMLALEPVLARLLKQSVRAETGPESPRIAARSSNKSAA
jgi:DNA-binding MarR family transcriptional regulator